MRGGERPTRAQITGASHGNVQVCLRVKRRGSSCRRVRKRGQGHRVSEPTLGGSGAAASRPRLSSSENDLHPATALGDLSSLSGQDLPTEVPM